MAGFRTSRPSFTADARTNDKTPCTLRTVAGSRVAISSVIQVWTSAGVTSASRVLPHRG